MQTQGTAEPLPKSKWTLFNAPTVLPPASTSAGSRLGADANDPDRYAGAYLGGRGSSRGEKLQSRQGDREPSTEIVEAIKNIEAKQKRYQPAPAPPTPGSPRHGRGEGR